MVDWRFSGVFRKFRCANVVFLHGKRGAVIGETRCETAIKSAPENRTGFEDLFDPTCRIGGKVQEK
jgi:hypothetical protein